MRKGELVGFLSNQHPDILCLQEVKIKPEQVDFQITGYQLVLNSAERSGYAGTGLLISDQLAGQLDLASVVRRDLPASLVDEYNLARDKFGNPNSEGRVLTIELTDSWRTCNNYGKASQ